WLAEGFPQIDVLTARAGPQRRELRVGHRAGEGKRAARHPRGEEEHRVGHEHRDLRWREEDAAADDVGDDDGGGVERTETPLERGRGRGLSSRVARSDQDYCVSS